MYVLVPCEIWSQKQIEVSDPVETKSVDTAQAEEIFAFAEVMPRFPGCEDLEVSNYEKSRCAQAKLIEYVSQNLKYPEEAKLAKAEGNVIVRFIVEKDGTLSGINAPRDMGYGCGAEAVRVVESMNAMPLRWTPGYIKGKPARVSFMLPIAFRM